MSVPRKGSRTIVVGDAKYRWYVRRRPTDEQALGGPMLIAIERVGEPGVLVVNCVVQRPDAYVGHGGAVTPIVVREMIERAIAAGWAVGTAPPTGFVFPLSADVIGRLERDGWLAVGARRPR